MSTGVTLYIPREVKLVKQLHPDLGGDPAAFRTVQAAYEVLEDANARGRLASTE